MLCRIHAALVLLPSACFDCSLSMQQWEGLIELLGSQSKIAWGLDFLHKYEYYHYHIVCFIALSYVAVKRYK